MIIGIFNMTTCCRCHERNLCMRILVRCDPDHVFFNSWVRLPPRWRSRFAGHQKFVTSLHKTHILMPGRLGPRIAHPVYLRRSVGIITDTT